jgi:hypothetical protein
MVPSQPCYQALNQGLPDGKFSYQVVQLGKVWWAFEWKMFVLIFYGHML